MQNLQYGCTVMTSRQFQSGAKGDFIADCDVTLCRTKPTRRLANNVHVYEPNTIPADTASLEGKYAYRSHLGNMVHPYLPLLRATTFASGSFCNRLYRI